LKVHSHSPIWSFSIWTQALHSILGLAITLLLTPVPPFPSPLQVFSYILIMFFSKIVHQDPFVLMTRSTPDRYSLPLSIMCFIRFLRSPSRIFPLAIPFFAPLHNPNHDCAFQNALLNRFAFLWPESGARSRTFPPSLVYAPAFTGTSMIPLTFCFGPTPPNGIGGKLDP